MAQANSAGTMSGPLVMLISAALFGYFGFSVSWAHKYTTDNPPQLIPMIAVLEWTLRGGALVFFGCALLAMARSPLGEVLFSIAGLITAVVFVVVAVWQWTNPRGFFSGVPPFLLLVFAAWNGYGSWMALREIAELRRSAAPSATMPLP